MEHSKAYSFAVKYYPKRWNKTSLGQLVEAGKLYDWEYEAITGEPYEA